ncbi:type VII secretion-associated serine protease mycosin [Plantactinospora siamensis]|uniref:Type VII secretion-associated serine protease mycosin n=1 Tax=Plantactinospora siamensis TaxID=555372 RepID=A0ABV6NWV0_9ACTN
MAAAPTSVPGADRVRADQWHLRYLHVAEAQQISRGAGVTVAVIDTGIEGHPDLQGNLLPGRDTFPGGTGDGRQDAEGHGTGMAGLIAAHGEGGRQGALGIAPDARLLPVRYAIHPGTTNADADSVAASIDWAITQGARVLNLSFTGGSTASEVMAVRKALQADAVLVAGAGNRPDDLGVGFPAAMEGVLAVGATDRSGKRAAISVTGRKLGIVAPGVDIYSTGLHGGYRKGTGTSDATAIVAGAAALVRSRFPDLSAAEVVHRLTATATDRGPPGRDDEYGYGELNLVAALTADVPPLSAGPSGPGPGPAASGTAASGPVSPGPTGSAPPASRGPVTAVVVGLAVLLAIVVAGVLLAPRLRH